MPSRQIEADAPAAQHQHVAYAVGVLAQIAEIRCDRQHIGRDVNAVARAYGEIAVRYNDLPVALNDGVEHLRHAAQLLGEILELYAHHRVVLLRAELDHLHAAARKRLDVAGKGEAQQPADFQRRGALGVDRHVYAQLALEHRQALVVFGIAHAGDGVARAQPLGDQAAEHIGLVARRRGNDDVGVLSARFDERLRVGAVAAHAQYVQRLLAALQRLLGIVHDDHVVALSGQIFGDDVPHLAVSDHQNFHNPSSVFRASLPRTISPVY